MQQHFFSNKKGCKINNFYFIHSGLSNTIDIKILIWFRKKYILRIWFNSSLDPLTFKQITIFIQHTTLKKIWLTIDFLSMKKTLKKCNPYKKYTGKSFGFIITYDIEI